MLYTDDSIFFGSHKNEADQAIQNIQDAKLNIKIEGDLQYLLGIKIDSRQYGSINLTQPHLIDKILEDLKIGKTTMKFHTSYDATKIIVRKGVPH